MVWRGCKKGNAGAMYELGILYSGDLYDNKNEALKWLRKALSLGIMHANVEIHKIEEEIMISKMTANELFTKGKEFYDRGEYKEAINWLKKSASHGDKFAMSLLGCIYQDGKGVNNNYNEALKWHMNAAAKGSADSMYWIGRFYEDGLGVKKNYKEAFTWYLSAAKLGDAVAMNNVGVMYNDGKGVEKSLEKAKIWYKKSIEAGNNEAVNNLNALEKNNGCFITTATCSSLNKMDDCYELNMFRKFRDNWLSYQSDGESLINKYYQIAPCIVESINKNKESKKIYEEIWNRYLSICLSFIKSGENIKCKELYIEMVEELKRKYVSGKYRC